MDSLKRTPTKDTLESGDGSDDKERCLAWHSEERGSKQDCSSGFCWTLALAVATATAAVAAFT